MSETELELLDEHKIEGKRLAKARKELGIDQLELALGLGISARMVSHFETGLRRISISLLKRAYLVFKINPLFVAFGYGKPVFDENDETDILKNCDI